MQSLEALLWVKVLHIVMVIAWMVGIFYLPRIFVHTVEGQAAGEDVRRLTIMAQKLYTFMTIMAVFAVGSGFMLLIHYGLQGAGWMHGKLGVVCLMAVYHVVCGSMLKKIKNDKLNWSNVALRWFNEIPLVLLVGILYFVIVARYTGT